MNISTRYSFRFAFDRYGKGQLCLWQTMNGIATIVMQWDARSGSIAADGKLMNCITPGMWYLCKTPEIPAKEEYLKMYIPQLPGFGMKWRLSRTVNGDFTHYLFHVDGALPGSNGCIVLTMGNGVDLWTFGLNHMLTCGDIIPVEVVNA